MKPTAPAIWSLSVLLVGALSWDGLPLNPAVASAGSSYTLFESGQVRPLALSSDRSLLFAVNTPDNRLEIFRATDDGLSPLASVPVGLEPVAVAARTADQVWVVNHLSDSVSIVDVGDPTAPRVVRTLLVGDEPRDIVFAGPGRRRAFITAARRGQNGLRDPQLTTPGVGRADVWVFDAEALGTSVGGQPMTVLTLFTDTPRALAATPDGRRVYAAGFQTGNRTTTLHEGLIPDGGEAEGGLPSTRVDAAGEEQPETGLIVQHDGAHWVDELGRTWDQAVRFGLPDRDVFAIDAMATPPAAISGPSGFWTGVGTILFNMAVNPHTGAVYVSNTDAGNLRRFEGPGTRLGRNHTVQGRLTASRITVIHPNAVIPRHLNPHINYEECCAPIPNAEGARSLAQPMGLAVTGDGRTLYVAAFGSSKIAVLATEALETDGLAAQQAPHIRVSGGGPSGLALDEPRGRLYVLTRFDNAISILDTAAGTEIDHITMPSPEPPSVVQGRRFLYDAEFTSSHGDSACGSCHIFGDFDSLAWDLGDPDGATISNPGPFRVGPTFPSPTGGIVTVNPHFRALKGPMTTQSLRGMANHGAMHWRGDRTAANDEPSVQPDGGAFNEAEAFKRFNVAFPGLNGRHAPLAPSEMQAFADFILQITYPPNPIRALDNSLTPMQQRGRAIFFGDRSDTFFNCNGCHVLDPHGNRAFGVAQPGFFGTDGQFSFENETQIFKIPHLRNLYQKIGMFGMAPASFFLPGDNGFKGDQVRGFGFLHDGSTDTLFRFHGATVFIGRPARLLSPSDPGNPAGFPFLPPVTPFGRVVFLEGVLQRRAMEQFMLAFDSNLAPIVGQQVTLTGFNAWSAGPRVDLLIARADAGECDLIVKHRGGTAERGYLYLGGGLFAGDRAGDSSVSDGDLRLAARGPESESTYTCAPPGSGPRMAYDRDEDGRRDGDERAMGSDPADPTSTPR